MSDLVPGRPATDPAQGCPFCLGNNLFKGELIVEGDHGFAAKIADDLVLLCPFEHLETDFTETPFASEFVSLLGRTMAKLAGLGWTDYNLVLNVGYTAGVRVHKDPDGTYRHPHFKFIRRLPGQPASDWGLDALIRMVNNSPVPLRP